MLLEQIIHLHNFIWFKNGVENIFLEYYTLVKFMHILQKKSK